MNKWLVQANKLDAEGSPKAADIIERQMYRDALRKWQWPGFEDFEPDEEVELANPPIIYAGSFGELLRHSLHPDLIQKLGLDKYTNLSAFILEPELFYSIFGRGHKAAIVNDEDSVRRLEEGMYLEPGSLENSIPFIVIVSSSGGSLNIGNLIHEGIHMRDLEGRPEFGRSSPNIVEYVSDPDEINAFLNEIIVFRHLRPNASFDQFMLSTSDPYNIRKYTSSEKTGDELYHTLKLLWDRVSGLSPWSMKPKQSRELAEEFAQEQQTRLKDLTPLEQESPL